MRAPSSSTAKCKNANVLKNPHFDFQITHFMAHKISTTSTMMLVTEGDNVPQIWNKNVSGRYCKETVPNVETQYRQILRDSPCLKSLQSKETKQKE